MGHEKSNRVIEEPLEVEKLNKLQNKFSPAPGPEIQLISGSLAPFQGLNELVTLNYNILISPSQFVTTLHFKGHNVKLEHPLKEHASFAGRKMLIMRC